MLLSVIPGAEGSLATVSMGELAVGLTFAAVPQAASARAAMVKIVVILERPKIFEGPIIESRSSFDFRTFGFLFSYPFRD